MVNGVDRRAFLKGAAVGTAAAFVSPVVLSAEQKGTVAKKPRLGLPREEMPVPDLKSEELICQGKPFTGRVTAGGRPLAGVVVTNGRDSVRTGKDGVYALPEYPGARFISVTTPSGYRANWFYVDAWRRLGGFDFSLEPTLQTAGRGCKFVHIADSEIQYAAAAGTMVKNLKALVERENCAFVVHTGDICGRQGLIAHAQAMNDVTMGRRMVYCLGNHDCVSTWPWGEAQFEAVYGPAWYSFDAGGVHFLVTPMVNGDRPPSYDEDQIADWIRGDLALVPKDRPVVLFNHYLPNGGKDVLSGVIYGSKRPLDLRKACNYRGCVYGHTHNTWFRRRDGVAFVNTSNPNMGGIDHSPNCARVITVSETGEITSKTFFGDFKEMGGERAGALWETRLPAGVLHGGLVDGGEVLYCATSDDDGQGTGFVCAVEKASGAIRWQAKTGNTVKGALALAAGAVIGTDVEGRVQAFRQSDGKEMWSVDLSEGVSCGRPMLARGTTASPDGRRVLVGVGYRQAVLDAPTGKVVWRHPQYWEGEPVATRSAFADGKVVTPGNWVPLRCLDAETGKELWQCGRCRFPGAMPLVKDGQAVVADANGLFVLDLATGKVLREKAYEGYHAVAIPGDILETERFYLKGLHGRGLAAIDKRTLDIVWTGAVGPSLVSAKEYAGPGVKSLNTTPVLVDAKTVCASCADGAIHFWDLEDGKSVREIKTGVPYLGGVVVSDGKVFAADLAGMIRAFAID